MPWGANVAMQICAANMTIAGLPHAGCHAPCSSGLVDMEASPLQAQRHDALHGARHTACCTFSHGREPGSTY